MVNQMKTMKTWFLVILLSLISFTIQAESLSDWKFESSFNSANLSDFDYIGEIIAGSKVSVITDAGNNVLSADAAPQQDTTVGKAYISKNFPDIFAGDTIEISANYFINKYLNDGKIYLLDLECRECGWDKKPGIRIYMSEKGFLGVNRDKLGSKLGDFKSGFQVPLKRYFRLKVSYTLGVENGFTIIWIDDKPILQEQGVNMPSIQIFLRSNIALSDEKFSYAQFGVTANSSKTKRALLNVDDVEITIFRPKK
jgi:hypothetical protein